MIRHIYKIPPGSVVEFQNQCREQCWKYLVEIRWVCSVNTEIGFGSPKAERLGWALGVAVGGEATQISHGQPQVDSDTEINFTRPMGSGEKIQRTGMEIFCGTGVLLKQRCRRKSPFSCIRGTLYH